MRFDGLLSGWRWVDNPGMKARCRFEDNRRVALRVPLVVGTSNLLNLGRVDSRDVGFWLRGWGSKWVRCDISGLYRQDGRLGGGTHEEYKVG